MAEKKPVRENHENVPELCLPHLKGNKQDLKENV